MSATLVELLKDNAAQARDAAAECVGGRRTMLFGEADLMERAASDIYCLRRIVGDIRTLYYAGVFKQHEGEPWLVRVLNIDIHS